MFLEIGRVFDTECGGSNQVCENNTCEEITGCAQDNDCQLVSGGGPNATLEEIEVSLRPVPANVLTLGDDQVSETLVLGFDFEYFGATFNQAQISSNGFLVLGGNQDSGCCDGETLPGNAAPANIIALYWEDLNPRNGGQISFGIQGEPGNREFVVMFDAVPHFGNNEVPVTAQAVLREADNSIELICVSCPSDGGQHTQGIQNGDRTFGLTAPGRNATDFSLENDAVRFTTLVEGGDPFECFGGQCVPVPSCNTNADCQFGPPGLICGEDGFCRSSFGVCVTDDQCPGNQSCVLGLCFNVGNPECVRDSQCASGLCENQRCQ